MKIVHMRTVIGAILLPVILMGKVWANPSLDLSTASGKPCEQVTVYITLTNEPEVEVAATSNDIGYDARYITLKESAIGPAGEQVGKSVMDNIVEPGLYRVSVLSLTELEPIPDGVVAYVTFEISCSAPGGTYVLSNSPSSSSAQGNPLVVEGIDGLITVPADDDGGGGNGGGSSNPGGGGGDSGSSGGGASSTTTSIPSPASATTSTTTVPEAGTTTTVQIPVPVAITSSPVTVAFAGVLYTYNVDTNADGDNLICSLNIKPAGMEIDEETGKITWKPKFDQIGKHDAEVQIENESGDTDVQKFVIQVKPKAMSNCPAGAVLDEKEESLQILRKFRDNRLLKSTVGLSIVTLYYTHGQEITGILYSNPEIMAMSKDLSLEILPAIGMTITSQGTIILTKYQYRSVTELLRTISEKSSLGLWNTISFILKILKSDDHLGQMRVETE